MTIVVAALPKVPTIDPKRLAAGRDNLTALTGEDQFIPPTAVDRPAGWPCGFGALSARAENRPAVTGWGPGIR